MKHKITVFMQSFLISSLVFGLIIGLGTINIETAVKDENRAAIVFNTDSLDVKVLNSDYNIIIPQWVKEVSTFVTLGADFIDFFSFLKQN